MRETSPRRWAAGTAVAGTVFIAAGAFWLSFTSLADLAARSGGSKRGQAWAWPLIVDGIIVVATVAVVALAGQRSAWYPWALLTRWRAGVGRDRERDPRRRSPPTPTCPASLPPPSQPSHPSCCSRSPTSPSSSPAPQTPRRNRRHLAGMRSPCLLPAPDELEAAPASVGIAELASAPAEAESLDPADRRALGWELREAGWSNKRIARELSVHPPTVGRWFTPAHLTTDINESADEREETTP